jgi:DNA-binding transcriptional ArsR family regulator
MLQILLSRFGAAPLLVGLSEEEDLKMVNTVAEALAAIFQADGTRTRHQALSAIQELIDGSGAPELDDSRVRLVVQKLSRQLRISSTDTGLVGLTQKALVHE